MWVCVGCGYVFKEPQHWEERHGFDHGPFECRSGCPECGDVYVKAHRCDACDEWITGDYIKTSDDKRYCRECYQLYELGDED